MEERLNKFIARCGVTSRRKADRLIEAGDISINNRVVQDVVGFVDPDTDKVTYKGRLLIPPDNFVYYVLNKPRGYISTVEDVYAQKKVVDLVPDKPRVFPVGRLDKDSEGLIILTDDGDLALKLTHPRYEHEKEYLVTVEGSNEKSLTAGDLQKRFEKYTKSDMVSMKIIATQGKIAELNFVLKEGKKRQIRRMCSSVGLKVIRLLRIRIANLKLNGLPAGQFKRISKKDIIQ